jgi:hypothetical protein
MQQQQKQRKNKDHANTWRVSSRLTRTVQLQTRPIPIICRATAPDCQPIGLGGQRSAVGSNGEVLKRLGNGRYEFLVDPNPLPYGVIENLNAAGVLNKRSFDFAPASVQGYGEASRMTN